MIFYRMSGLSVASEVPLPGLIEDDFVPRTPDARVRLAAVPAALEEATSTGVYWQLGEKQLLLRLPGIARFLVSEGRDIAFEPEGGMAVEDVTAFLVGTVFGALLHQRGRVVLHASAVQVGDRAMLFCGPSGAGKSTMAAALSREGFAMLTDDVCALEFVDGKIMVNPDGRRLKLWNQAIGQLNLADRRGEPVRNNLQKFFVEPVVAQSAPVPLASVYVLIAQRPPLTPGIRKLPLAEAPLALRRNAYRPLLVQRLGQRPDYFHAAVAISAAGGMHHIVRPLDFTALPVVIAALREHWALGTK